MDERFPRVGGILRYFVRHRTAANLLLVILLAAGTASFPQMRSQFFPDVVVDSIRVNVSWEGAGAEDVDRAVIQLLEPALLAVEGVESSQATSREGSAGISLDFESGWDMSRAADDVQAAVDAVNDLPEDAGEPHVRRGAWRDRVTDVVITGPVGVDQLGRFADEFLSRLFAAGVTRTTVRGVAAPETVVETPSLALIRNDISMREIADAIAAEAAADPAGDVDGANARVRTGVAKIQADAIAGIVLRSNPDGSKLTIGDIGEVTVGGIDRDRTYFVGEDTAISIRVDRSDRGDAIEIQQTIERVAEELRRTLPESVTIELIRTRAEAISGRLGILLENGLIGLCLVVSLLFLFLNARTAFWVAAGIPVAMTATIAMMYAFDFSFNMVSLFALIITLGIVVDDAIIVGEHADFRAKQLGEIPVEAAENAARRMFPPVLSASLTTIIAFGGLVVIGGRFGELIADIPFTVIVVLTASLLECFLILPNHMAHSVANSMKRRWYDLPSHAVNIGLSWFRETVFRRLINLVITARYPVLAGAIFVLCSQIAPVISGDLQWRFFNAPELGSVSGNFAMSSGATREDTLEMMREMQRATDTVAKRLEEEHGRNPLDYVIAEIGGNTGRGLGGVENKESYQLGSIGIELIDADLRSYSSFQFVSDLQDEVRRHPLVETISFRGWRFGQGSDALDVQLYGADSETLKAAAEELKTALARYPEVSALEDTLSYDREELILELTPKGEALGFTIDGLGRVLRNRLNGIEAATYPQGLRSASIRVELPVDELTADFLERTRMRTQVGAYVPLADIVSVKTRDGFSKVERENGLRLVSVTGDISEDDPERANEILEALRSDLLPGIEERFGVASALSGLIEQENEFLNDSRIGLLLCLLGIYLCLSWIFASWTKPLIVMSVIPFGLAGALWGHLHWGVPLSMFSVIGLIGTTGIIINDSIVLVTTIDGYARERGLIPAIVDGVCDRLRAVILTTLTTVLGLSPLLYEQSQQAQFLKPAVITLVYGLGFGMFLVLLVLPALLAMQNDIVRQFGGLRRALKLKRRSRPASAATVLAALAVTALFIGTLGRTILNGAPHPALMELLPKEWLMAVDTVVPAVALALFIGGTAITLLVSYALSATLLAVFGRSPRT